MTQVSDKPVVKFTSLLHPDVEAVVTSYAKVVKDAGGEQKVAVPVETGRDLSEGLKELHTEWLNNRKKFGFG